MHAWLLVKVELSRYNQCLTHNQVSWVVVLIEVDSNLIGTVRCVAPHIGLVRSLLQHHMVPIDGRETKLGWLCCN